MTGGATDLVSVALTSEGAPVGAAVQVVSVEITRAVNRLPRAVLEIEDGDAAAQDFPVSGAAAFAPGARIGIACGYGTVTAPVFAGRVLRHRVVVPANGRPRLVLELADAAVAMTLARRSAVWTEMTLADVLRQVIAGHDGLSAEIGGSFGEAVREQLVQDRVSDWDFLVAEAEAAGAEVTARDGVVRVAPPPGPGAETLDAAFGVNVVAADLELDAAAQIAGVEGRLWEAAEQAVAEAEAAEPDLSLSLRQDGAALAALFGDAREVMLRLDTVARAEVAEAAGARLARHRAAALRGTVTVEGTAAAQPGALVRLAGFGDRLSGSAALAGLRHVLRDGSWLTELVFGRSPRAHADRFPDARAPASGAEPAAAGGLRIGIVEALEGDPQGAFRAHVRLPGQGEAALWARLALPHAGDDRGVTFLPEIGDEVVVGFLDGALRAPVVLGALHSAAAPPPDAPADANDVKRLRTRSGLEIGFDDANRALHLETPDGRRLALSDGDGAIRAEDAAGNTLTIDRNGVTVQTASKFRVEATEIELEGTALRLKGANVDVDGGGLCTIKGGVVQIN